MQALLALMRKDLVLYFSNRRAVLMSIVAPILIAAFFGSLFGGGNDKPANITVGVTDLDRSALSARVVASLRSDSALSVSEAAEADAIAQVRAGTLRAAVVLPAGFGERAGGALFGGTDKPVITLHYDPSQSMVLPLMRGLLAQHVMEPVAQNLFTDGAPLLNRLGEQVSRNASMPADQRSELQGMFDSIVRVQQRAASAPAGAASGPTFSVPFTLREQQASSRPGVAYNSYAHSFAGMGVQFILLMGVDLAVGLLLMRRLGLWKRLRAAPLSRGVLLGSHVASTSAIALIIFTVIYAVAMVAFGVRVQGSVVGFVLVLASFALLTASFGLLIAALGRTPEATRGLAILATLLLVMLGGAWVPSFIFPAWLQTVSLAVPTRWAIDGLDAMTWRGLPLDAALMPVAVMLGFTAAFFALALVRFRWDE